jgi:sarcosine oxidase subunit gamma
MERGWMVELIAHDPGSRHILRGPAGGTMLDGVMLPAQPCRAAEHGPRAALWLGPDEWLLLGFGAPETEFALIDITHRQLGFRLDGDEAATLLAAGVPLDLAETAFPVGMCTRTLFEKAEITLWRRGAQAWQIEIARSFAPYLREMAAAIVAAGVLVDFVIDNGGLR